MEPINQQCLKALLVIRIYRVVYILAIDYTGCINIQRSMDSHISKELEAFYRQFTLRNYKKGEMLIRADDDPLGIFCLTKGYIRQYIISETGHELTLNILKPVSYFPMVWAVNETPNKYFFEALTPVEVGRAPKEKVIDFVKNNPVILMELISELLEDYAESLTRVEHLVFSDAYRRVISVLIYIGNHFGEKDGNSLIVYYRFSQQDIATLVGVARETASNEIIKLKKKGFIKYKGNTLIITDFVLLKKELSKSYH